MIADKLWPKNNRPTRTTRPARRSSGGSNSTLEGFRSSLKAGASCHWSNMGWSGEFNEGVRRVQDAVGVGDRPATITAEQFGNARAERTLVQGDGARAVRYYSEMVDPAAAMDLKIVQALNKSRTKRNDLGFDQFESHLKYGESVVANKGKEAAALHELNQNEIEVNTMTTRLSYGYV